MVSVGSKFALWALVLPILLVLTVSGIAYILYSNPFLLALVAALTSAIVLVWGQLRSTVREKTRQLWDTYLRPLNDSFRAVAYREYYLFPEQDSNGSKVDFSKYGKYGPMRLYPKSLVRKNLLTSALTAGREFNQKLNQFMDKSRADGTELNVYYAFDRWGLRKIIPGQPPRLAPVELNKQNVYLDLLEKTKKQEITSLTQSWEKALKLSKEIISILDKFSSENGMMPPKPPSIFTGLP